MNYDSSAKLKALRQLMLDAPSGEEKAITITIANGAKGESRLPQEESGSDLSKYLKEMSPGDLDGGPEGIDEDDSEYVKHFEGYLRGK